MAKFKIEEIKARIKALEALKKQCNEAEIAIVGYQNNDKLIKVLEEEYPKLFSAGRNQILALVDGKKELTKVDNATRNDLEFQLKGNCYINKIEPNDKAGKLLPFKKISAKITKEISTLNKIIDSYLLETFYSEDA